MLRPARGNAAMYTRPPPVTGCTLRGNEPVVVTLLTRPAASTPFQIQRSRQGGETAWAM